MGYGLLVIDACAALLPVILYLAVVYSIDRFSLITLRRLMMFVLCGVLTAVVCFAIFQLFSLLHSHINVSTIINPFVEELTKALPLFILARRRKMVFFIDSVICGAAVGAGYCMVENLLYLFGGVPLAVGTALFRGLEVALIHMGCSALIAAGLMFAVRIKERRRSRLEIKQKDLWMVILLLFSAPLLHILHNAILNSQFAIHNSPVIQLAVVFAFMGGLLAWTFDYDSRMIRRWVDRGLDKQLELLNAIREGRFVQTPMGQYLLAVKDSFPPEVFFDLICYVQLHVELLIAAKSRFMAHEAGMEYIMDEERRRTLMSQHEEYRELERRLGSTARMTVAPLLKYYPADRKALADLIEDCK